MANPNPEPHPENLRPIKPGEVRNPAGYSRRRRITDAIERYIDEHGLEPALLQTWLAMAIGDKKALKGREPDYRFFAMLLDRLEGKVGDVGLEPKGGDDDEQRIKVRRRKTTKRPRRPGSDDPD